MSPYQGIARAKRKHHIHAGIGDAYDPFNISGDYNFRPAHIRNGNGLVFLLGRNRRTARQNGKNAQEQTERNAKRPFHIKTYLSLLSLRVPIQKGLAFPALRGISTGRRASR